MRKDSKSDIFLAIALLGIVALIYWVIIPTQISVPATIQSTYLSPAFSPRVFSLYLGVMAAVLLVISIIDWRKSTSTAAQQHTGDSGMKVKSAVKEQLLVFGIWVVCVIYICSIYFVGIIIPSALLLGVLMVFFGQKRPVVVVSILIVAPLILYLFFHDLANVSFPQGILFE